MRLVIELHGSDHGGVLPADDEIVAESIAPIVPLAKFESSLYAEYTRDLDLCEDDVIGQRANQSVIEGLFGLR